MRNVTWLLVAILLGSGAGQRANAAEPGAERAISLHPDNPRYFLFRGKPLVLITASEHYGSVVNRAFDFDRYLVDAAAKHQTLTRTFLLFREQQSSRNPSSPIKPESPDYVAPYPRVGPAKAMDGEPVYDLDRWNEEYFARLHRFLARAAELGIIVELTLFSNTYGDPVWALNPLRAQNNLQKIGAVEWQDYNSLKDAALNQRQFAYVDKIVQETARYDNVYYEICNEPGGGFPNHASPDDIDRWQAEIGRRVRAKLSELGRDHLIFASQAFTYTPKFTQPLDATFAGPLADAVNVHPLPDTVLGGRAYQLGNFMSKELKLAELADFLLAARQYPKPCVLDEDNTATLYRDTTGWTIHRKRAWVAVVGGAHYDFIDFSITVGSETGTRASSAEIRTWMKHLSDFAHAVDLVHAVPAADLVERKPEPLVAVSLALADRRYISYLADAREIGASGAGEAIQGEVALRLPPGKYLARLYSPVSGEYSPGIELTAGQSAVTLPIGPFREDLLLDVRRADTQ